MSLFGKDCALAQRSILECFLLMHLFKVRSPLIKTIFAALKDKNRYKNGIRDACSTADIIDCLLVCFYVFYLFLSFFSVFICFHFLYLFYLFYLLYLLYLFLSGSNVFSESNILNAQILNL